jgi:hypothetical protein
VAHSLLEAWMLEEDKTLGKNGLACASTDVVLWHVAYQEETEYLLENVNVFIVQRRDKFS